MLLLLPIAQETKYNYLPSLQGHSCINTKYIIPTRAETGAKKGSKDF